MPNPPIKFGWDRFTGAGAAKPPFNVDYVFSRFFDHSTARTAEPILMVDSSNARRVSTQESAS
jgi:hypothetical protein